MRTPLWETKKRTGAVAGDYGGDWAWGARKIDAGARHLPTGSTATQRPRQTYQTAGALFTYYTHVSTHRRLHRTSTHTRVYPGILIACMHHGPSNKTRLHGSRDPQVRQQASLDSLLSPDHTPEHVVIETVNSEGEAVLWKVFVTEVRTQYPMSNVYF